MFWKKGLLVIIAFALLVIVGSRQAAAESTNANTSDKESVQRAKIAVGSNANATVTIGLITDGGAGNQIDDGMTSASAGANEEIAIEVFVGEWKALVVRV